MSVHVSDINSSVKKINGKLTTTYITDRMIHEATALLQPHAESSVEKGDKDILITSF
jgi:hypothetical protein